MLFASVLFGSLVPLSLLPPDQKHPTQDVIERCSRLRAQQQQRCGNEGVLTKSIRPRTAKKSQKPLTGLEPVTLGLKVPRNSQLCYRGDNVWLFTMYLYGRLDHRSLKEALHALCRHLQTRAGYRTCRKPCCIRRSHSIC